MALSAVTCLAAAYVLLCVSSGWGATGSDQHHLGTRADDVNILEVAQARMATDLQAMQAKLAALESHVARLVTPLAFTAETGSDSHYDDGATVKFGRVLLNEGNMYDSHTGLINVPQDGLYMAYVRSDPGNTLLNINHVTLDLKVNGVHQVYVYGQHGSTGSMSAALRLHAGDKVWVTKRDGLSNVSNGAMLSVVKVSV